MRFIIIPIPSPSFVLRFLGQAFTYPPGGRHHAETRLAGRRCSLARHQASKAITNFPNPPPPQLRQRFFFFFNDQNFPLTTFKILRQLFKIPRKLYKCLPSPSLTSCQPLSAWAHSEFYCKFSTLNNKIDAMNSFSNYESWRLAKWGHKSFRNTVGWSGQSFCRGTTKPSPRQKRET